MIRITPRYYALHNSDVTIDFKTGKTTVHQNSTEPWSITLVDTGDRTQTGGRLRRVQEYVGDEDFCFTYGDGLSDVNIADVIELHRRKGTKATLTAAPAARPFRRARRFDEHGKSSQLVDEQSAALMVRGSTERVFRARRQ